MDRLEFQRQCVARTTGTVYNVGSANDPARLRVNHGGRVLNCDMRNETDRLGQHVCPQLQFDCTGLWPVADDSGDLVVLGDIIEHLTDTEIRHVFAEAHRVARQLCVTVPLDDRPWSDPKLGRLPPGDYEWYAKWEGRLGEAPKPRPHINEVTRAKLESLLALTGWRVEELHEVDYGFVPKGFLVLAARSEAEGRADG